jgi:AraC-like DNA-binding protein
MTTITHTTFHREFVREFKVSPARYIEDLRVKDAVHLLETTDATASAIAVHCGFDNLLRFRCTLKRRMGMGPALYRKRQGERLKVKGQGGREQQGERLRVKGERLRVKGTVGSGETHPSVPSQEGKMEGAPRVSDSTKQPELKPELRREPIGVRVLRLLDKNPLGKKSLSLRLGQKEVSGQLNKVIRMLLADHAIEWTIPGKPNSKMQQYRLTDKGHTHLAEKKLLPAGS